jgi:hypothetical protein
MMIELLGAALRPRLRRRLFFFMPSSAKAAPPRREAVDLSDPPLQVRSDLPSADPPDPPSLAELAERTRRSAPPPAPAEDREGPYDAFTEAYDPEDLRYPFDSILPATLDAFDPEDRTPPAPFDLVNGRPSSLGFAAARRASWTRYAAAALGLAMLSLIAVAAPRVRLAAPASPTDAAPHRMTPAEAASWAVEPFTVDLPAPSLPEPSRVAAPSAREAEAAPLPHFDVEAAAVALAEAKSSLSECGVADEAAIPVSVRVAVTFSPKGNVTAAQIDPPAEVVELPMCVVERLRAVRVAAFAGPSLTVRTTVTFVPAGEKP